MGNLNIGLKERAFLRELLIVLALVLVSSSVFANTTATVNYQNSTYCTSYSLAAGGAENSNSTTCALNVSVPDDYYDGFQVNMNYSALISCFTGGINPPTNCQHFSWWDEDQTFNNGNETRVGFNVTNSPPYANVYQAWNATVGANFNKTNCPTWFLGYCTWHISLTTNATCGLGSPCTINTTVSTENYSWFAYRNEAPVNNAIFANKSVVSQYNRETIVFFANFTDDNGTSSVVLTVGDGASSTNYSASLYNGSNTNGYWSYNTSFFAGGASYTYNFTAFDGDKAAISSNAPLVITQNSSWNLNHTINNSAADLTGAFPMTAKVDCNTNTNPSVTVTEARNGSIQAIGTSTSVTQNPAYGDLAWLCSSSSNVNYSSISSTFYTNVSKGSVNVSLFLNGTHNNRTYLVLQTVNASAFKNITGEGNLTLQRNSSNVAFGVNNAEESNQTSAISQTFNYSACFSASENYSASCREFWANFDAPPAFQWFSLNLSNGTQYSPFGSVGVLGNSIQVFANFSDDNGVDAVVLSWNSSNYTMSLWNGSVTNGVWNYNLTLQKGAGFYDFNFTANDTQASGNLSSTSTFNNSVNTSWSVSQDYNAYTINLSTWINQFNGSYASTTRIYCYSVGIPSIMSPTFNLYLNGTLKASGTQITEYNETPVVGFWNYSCYSAGNQNYSTAFKERYFNVSLGMVNLTLHLNGSNSNRAYVFGQTVNASGFSNVSALVFRLLRNATIVANSTTPTENNASLAAGDYNYSLYWQGNENYSTAMQQWFANVSKGSVNITLVLNGSNANTSYNVSETVNASASKNTSEGNLTLSRNSTGVAFGLQVAEEANQTSLTNATFNYTACFPESENFTANCTVQYWANFANNSAAGGGDEPAGGGYIRPTPSPSPRVLVLSGVELSVPPAFDMRLVVLNAQENLRALGVVVRGAFDDVKQGNGNGRVLLFGGLVFISFLVLWKRKRG